MVRLARGPRHLLIKGGRGRVSQDAGAEWSELSPLDARLLRRAIRLGRKGWGSVHPNPMVGAVAATGDRILGEGYHRRFGGAHAERRALSGVARGEAETLYVSLEPCGHRGKTPPCIDFIAAAGIRRVVFWASDPTGVGGAAQLRESGAQVLGPFGGPAEWAFENPFFFRDRAVQRPFVAVKLAMSLDARIAPRGGRRVWLTGEEAREEAHRLRAGYGAVMAGANTIRQDDPELSPRGSVAPRIPPVKALLDGAGELTAGARAFRRPGGGVYCFTQAARAPLLRRRLGPKARVRAVPFDAPRGEGSRLDLERVLETLAQEGVESVLCEGGGKVAASLISSRLADRIYLFVAPLFIGPRGVEAFALAESAGAGSLGLGRDWTAPARPRLFGDDALLVLDRRG